jgi:uracil DNA glycosylase
MAWSIREIRGQDPRKRTARALGMAAAQQEEHRAPARFIAEPLDRAGRVVL